MKLIRKIISILLVAITVIGLAPNISSPGVYADSSSQPGDTTHIKLVHIGKSGGGSALGHPTDLQFVTYGEYNYKHAKRAYFCGMRKSTSNSAEGEALYCIQPGTPLNNNTTPTYVGNYWDQPSQLNPTLSRQQTRVLLSRVLSAGYKGNLKDSWVNQWNKDDNTKNAIAHYIATQLLVWEVVVGERDVNFNHVTVSGAPNKILDMIQSSNPLKALINSKYNQMVSSVKSMNVLPSFCKPSTANAQTFELEHVGSEFIATLTDTNNVLAQYNFTSSMSGVTITRSGNKLTVKSTTAPTQPIIITASKTISTNNVIAWISGSKQNLIGYGPTTNETVKGYARLRYDIAQDTSFVITGTKVNEYDEPLPGATIGLFRFNESTFTAETAIATTVSDDTGSFAFTNLNSGPYIVAEIAAPDGYALTSETFYVTVGLEGQSIEIVITNYPALGSVMGYKQDEEGNNIDGALIGLFHEGTTVFTERTAYRLCVSGECSVIDYEYPGLYGWDDIPYGNYIIREITPPVGYLLNTTQYPITIDQPTNSVTLLGPRIINTKAKGAIIGRKVAEGEKKGIPLNDAVIGLYRGGTQNFEGTRPLATCITDDTGYFEFNALEYGDYIVREIAAPDGYVLTDTTYPVTIGAGTGGTGGKTVIIDIGDIVNEVCSFEFIKIDSTTNKPLAGATFKLAMRNAYNEYVTIGLYASDDTGVVAFDHLLHGTYRISEMRAPNGYVLNEVPIEIEVSSAGVTVTSDHEPTLYNGVLAYVMPNSPNRGDITGKKVDDNGAPLGGATIGLFETGNLTDAIMTTKSKTDGSFRFTNVLYGNYIVREIAAPAGYILSDAQYPVTIDGSGQSIAIEITNVRQQYSIDVIKRIKASDINWANGDPTFIFSLSSTEGAANAAGYHAIVSFSKEYVDANTGEDGYVEMLASFTDLYVGTYVLREKETLRYKLESITDVTDNGTVYFDTTTHSTYGDCVIFDLSADNYGKATFTNVKTNWADASHTFDVVNVITIN